MRQISNVGYLLSWLTLLADNSARYQGSRISIDQDQLMQNFLDKRRRDFLLKLKINDLSWRLECTSAGLALRAGLALCCSLVIGGHDRPIEDFRTVFNDRC